MTQGWVLPPPAVFVPVFGASQLVLELLLPQAPRSTRSLVPKQWLYKGRATLLAPPQLCH